MAHHVLLLEQVLQRAEESDVVHFHVDSLHFPFSRKHTLTHVTTLQSRLDIPDLEPLSTVYNGLPELCHPPGVLAEQNRDAYCTPVIRVVGARDSR